MVVHVALVYNAWIHETLPVAATPAQHASTFDYDGDGYNNGLEWTLRSDPAKAFLVVNTLVDEFNTPSGANLSLREAVRDAAASGGAVSAEQIARKVIKLRRVCFTLCAPIRPLGA